MGGRKARCMVEMHGDSDRWRRAGCHGLILVMWAVEVATRMIRDPFHCRGEVGPQSNGEAVHRGSSTRKAEEHQGLLVL